jgi:hypothetical protein
MSNLLGALIGAAIDRGDGDSGVKGAILGSVAEGAIKVMAPIVATYALGWAVQYGIRKAWHAMAGEDPVQDDGRLRTAGGGKFGGDQLRRKLDQAQLVSKKRRQGFQPIKKPSEGLDFRLAICVALLAPFLVR